MPSKKKKKKMWTKEPKITQEIIECTVVQTIHKWNCAGTLASIPKLLAWLRD
jgi:hypothetical protein